MLTATRCPLVPRVAGEKQKIGLRERRRRKSWTVAPLWPFVKGAAAAASGGFTFGPGLFEGGRARAQSLQAGGLV